MHLGTQGEDDVLWTKRQFHFRACVDLRLWLASSDYYYVCFCAVIFLVVIKLRRNDYMDPVKIWPIRGERSEYALYLLYPFSWALGPWTKGNPSERQLLQQIFSPISNISLYDRERMLSSAHSFSGFTFNFKESKELPSFLCVIFHLYVSCFF